MGFDFRKVLGLGKRVLGGLFREVSSPNPKPATAEDFRGLRPKSRLPHAIPEAPDVSDVLDADEEFLFLYMGEWVNTPQSAWIEKAHYDSETKVLEIQIQGGAFYQTPLVTESKAQEFYRASSKGEWVWRNGWREGTFVRMTAASPAYRDPEKRAREGFRFFP